MLMLFGHSAFSGIVPRCLKRLHFEAFRRGVIVGEGKRLCEASTVAVSELTDDLDMHRHFRCEAVASSSSGNGSSPSSPSSNSMDLVQSALGPEVCCLTFITLPSCTCDKKYCNSLWYPLDIIVRPFSHTFIALIPAAKISTASVSESCAICRLRQLWCKCKR